MLQKDADHLLFAEDEPEPEPEKIIDASADIFRLQSMQKSASGVLTQLTSMLNLHRDALHCSSLAAIGSYWK